MFVFTSGLTQYSLQIPEDGKKECAAEWGAHMQIKRDHIDAISPPGGRPESRGTVPKEEAEQFLRRVKGIAECAEYLEGCCQGVISVLRMPGEKETRGLSTSRRIPQSTKEWKEICDFFVSCLQKGNLIDERTREDFQQRWGVFHKLYTDKDGQPIPVPAEESDSEEEEDDHIGPGPPPAASLVNPTRARSKSRKSRPA
uniref:Uncharacterized protein n=1 Tax=Chromera velia CCMP2878 TaxID=1169474 RepID=A0A0G4HAP2_9ALVE|eukprot:Cvel_6057.t1-p1 / transcript=Cvel_6057.t1 / gene=Cvel_6057 / organism=Chromera_velia_CCMP2878 / gene_product=hypothetical protein / transcript_product=hypothetical protein / location=Cvel_scaffold291:65563-66156(+) / protein_length=198 / sequence_SO=supercontig / SO=protein_coding / is_pseudo=false